MTHTAPTHAQPISGWARTLLTAAGAATIAAAVTYAVVEEAPAVTEPAPAELGGVSSIPGEDDVLRDGWPPAPGARAEAPNRPVSGPLP